MFYLFSICYNFLMKNIYYAKKSHRILSRVIDLFILILTSVVLYVTLVFPNTFDKAKMLENNTKLVELYKDSGLFAVDSDGNYAAYSQFGNIKKVDDLYDVSITFNNKKYEGIKLSKALFEFYTTKYTFYGASSNLSSEVYKNNILKVGSTTSNIKEFDETTYKFTLIDSSKEEDTVTFFYEAFQGACKSVINSSSITSLTSSNQQILMSSLYWIIPVLAGFSFIFEFLIPLFSPHNETIGKHIFKIGIISDKGYTLKKYMLLPRWISYLLFEIILGVLSFGGTLLISYTMFMFTKKRKCLHDIFAKSIVIDNTRSIYFDNEKEESYYINRQRERGIDL